MEVKHGVSIISLSGNIGFALKLKIANFYILNYLHTIFAIYNMFICIQYFFFKVLRSNLGI